MQVSSLIYYMGPTAESVFQQLKFDSEDDKKDYTKVLDKFASYFKPSVNVFHKRALFEQCTHLPGETVEQFVRKLHDAAEDCSFTDKDTRIRDRFVAHLSDRATAALLQNEPPDTLTLQKAIERARTAERLSLELSSQEAASRGKPTVAATSAQSSRSSSSALSTIHPPRSGASRHDRRPSQHSSSSLKQGKCPWCGSSKSNHRQRRSECPARDKVCNACGKTGHFASVCMSTPKGSKQKLQGRHSAHSVDTLDVSDDHDSLAGSATFLGSLHSASTSDWSVTLRFCGVEVPFKIDTGADVSIITASTYLNLLEQPPLAPASPMIGPDGAAIACSGRFTTTATYKADDFAITLNVIESSTPANLLSRADSVRLGLVQRVNTASQQSPIGCMSGPPVHISLAPDATPYNCAVARRVPLPLYRKVEVELQRMEKEHIIVPVTQPTDWCSPMVPVVKPNGKVRLCVDLKRLNASVKREHFPLPTVDDTLSRLAGSSVFSVLDTTSGFWQIPLDESSSLLTTFITPFGRYRFLRLPFGITSAPEIFQRRLQMLLGHLKGVEVYMDDIIVHSATEAEHAVLLTKVKSVLSSAGLTLNQSKCQFHKSSVHFLGHVISAQGINADPSKLEAISRLAAPTDVSQLRHVLSLFTYLSRFLPDLATVSAPLRQLLHADATWRWDAPQETAFQQLKSMASSTPCLRHYYPSRPTAVSADASSYGLGAVLMQYQYNAWTPVAFASRSLTATERGYAQIEKECLASVWACERFHSYLYGLPQFTLETDHKPLVPLINTRDLDKVPIRCQRLLMRLLRYDARAVHVPGKNMLAADTLSRVPLPDTADLELQHDTTALLAVVSADLCSPALQDDIRASISSDAVLPAVCRYVLHGWPSTIPGDVQPYNTERSHLSFHDGILYHGFRVVIPPSLRSAMLSRIHEGHQGLTKCKARARYSVWWPGISTALHDYIRSCEECCKRRYLPPEPLQPTPLPSLPWSQVGCDLCEVDGKQYLVTVDYFSRYIDIQRLHTVTSSSVITSLKSLFAVHGVPSTVVSDNGPQFSSDAFAQFATTANFMHRTSSPRYPQSNGAAERAVQTAKRLITSSTDLPSALLAYRSTPIGNGYSPAQLLYGRRLRTSLPIAPELLKPDWPDLTNLREREEMSKEQQQLRFDTQHHAQPLSILPVGSRVWIDDLKREGVIKSQFSDRSYIIATASGQEVRRNRRHLKVLPSVQPTPDVQATAPEQQPAAVPTRRSPRQPRPGSCPPSLRPRTTVTAPERLITTC